LRRGVADLHAWRLALVLGAAGRVGLDALFVALTQAPPPQTVSPRPAHCSSMVQGPQKPLSAPHTGASSWQSSRSTPGVSQAIIGGESIPAASMQIPLGQ
jgi:hypothetical protein